MYRKEYWRTKESEEEFSLVGMLVNHKCKNTGSSLCGTTNIPHFFDKRWVLWCPDSVDMLGHCVGGAVYS